MKPADTEFITVDEASELLGVTRPGVIYMIKHGQLEGSRKVSEKLTATWLIPLSVVKAHPNYISKKKRGQTAKPLGRA